MLELEELEPDPVILDLEDPVEVALLELVLPVAAAV